MADIKGLMSDDRFNNLDVPTQKQVLGKLDSRFSNLSDDDYQAFRQKLSPAPSVSKDPTTNSANTALAGTGLSVNPPNPVAGTLAKRPDLALSPPSSQAPPSIPPRGFWGSAIDQVNPIPAVKDYFTKGPPIVQGLNSARSPESMPFPAGQGPGADILGQVAQPAQTAGRQIASGDYLGAGGTLAGGYGVPVATAALAPTVARYAPPMAKGALAGATKAVQDYKPSMTTHWRAGALGAALGEMTGVPHGWGYGIVAGEVLPPAYAAAKGAVKGAIKGFTKASRPVLPPRVSLAEQAGIQPSAIPPRPPVEPILPPDEVLPSGRQVGGPWNEPPEPPATLPREAPAWKTQGIQPTETVVPEAQPIEGQLPSGRKVGPVANPPRTPIWQSTTSTQAPEATISTIPPSVRTTGKAEPPPATTPVPEQTSSPSTTSPLETQLRDTKAYVDKHGELPKVKSTDPADLLRRQQAADEAHMANRRSAVDRAVANLESAGLTKEQIAELDPFKVMKDAGYKQKSLDPNTEQIYYERLGIERKMPAQAETTKRVYKPRARAKASNPVIPER